jgi:hypothetical protein
MLRRVAALIGIVLILAVLACLVWAVHQHKKATAEGDDVISANLRLLSTKEAS